MIDVVVAATLVLLTTVIYLQVIGFEFVNYDDTVYVPDNPHVCHGFSLGGIGWALTSSETANWYPLTWFSLMLDCQIFGVWPGGHHAVNAALHAVDAVLLFIVLRRMTAARWRSAAVAALFAVHPLHVESVAWIAERKDVLSTLFFLLTLLAYHRYAERPGFGRWIVVFFGMALGLMSKSMLVTLPAVLLLLDFWPLQRMDTPRFSSFRLLFEKLPLVALSLAVAVATIAAQASEGAMAMLHDTAGLPVRLANASIACVKYLAMLIWPFDLAVYYPYNFHPSAWQAALAGLLLAAASVGAAWWILISLVRSEIPPTTTMSTSCPGGTASAVAVGWLWYLFTLVPVIGLVQVGSQAMADRYCYIPSIGIFLATVWGITAAAQWALGPGRRSSIILAALTATTLAALLVVAHGQTSCWANSERLFRHALTITGDNPVACENLGDALLHREKFADAEAEFRKVLEMDAAHYRQTPPELAQAMAGQGRIDEAMACVRAIPDAAERAPAMQKLAIFFAPRHHVPAAIALLEQAIALAPQQPMGPRTLAWIYASCPDRRFRDGPKAVELARRACELSDGKNAVCRQTLADAYLEVGDRTHAAEELRAVLELNPGDAAAAEKLGSLGK